MKKILLVFVSILLLSFNSQIQDVEANSLKPQGMTAVTSVDDLVAHLEYVGGKEALETLKQVDALSEGNRKKLDELLGDPEKLLESMNNPENYTEETVYMYTDDTSDVEVASDVKSALSNVSVTAITRPKFSVYGVSFITYEVVGKFKVDNRRRYIVSSTSINGYVLRKWLPQVSTKVINKNMTSTTSSLYHGKVRFSYDLGVGNWGVVRVGTISTGVKSTPAGKVSGYLYRD